ncbi:MAG: tetratricopeptide repeat protein [Rhodothermales bacterium]
MIRLQRYCPAYTLFLAFALHMGVPGNTRAQGCEQAARRIQRITETEARQAPDSLRLLLNMAAFVRDCEEQPSRERALRLLDNEVFALDGLGRYEEAMTIVNQFFATYFDEAAERYRGRFYLWRLHLNALAGKMLEVIADYAAVQEYTHALHANHQAHLHLHAASAYIDIRENEKALNLVRKAEQLVNNPETYEERVVVARTKRLRGEAQLRTGHRLDEAKKNLRVATTLYESLGDTAQIAMVTMLLGETYAAAGDTSAALAELAEGLRLAQQSGSVQSMVATRYRYGQLLRLTHHYEAAEMSLSEALEASETVRPFYIRIRYELALIFEQQGNIEHAVRIYRTAMNTPLSTYSVAELEAYNKAHKNYIHLRFRVLEQEQTRFQLALGLLLFLSFGGGVVFLLFLRRRAPTVVSRLDDSPDLIYPLPTGETLEHLEQRFQQTFEPALFSRRLARLYAALFNPALLLPYLKDPCLARQVDTGHIANNTALFLCLAAAETAREGRTFSDNPANTLSVYLRREFKKRNWPWPTHPLAWRQYLMHHHVDALCWKHRAQATPKIPAR